MEKSYLSRLTALPFAAPALPAADFLRREDFCRRRIDGRDRRRHRRRDGSVQRRSAGGADFDGTEIRFVSTETCIAIGENDDLRHCQRRLGS